MQRMEVKGSELCIRKPLSFCIIKGAEPLMIHFFLSSGEEEVKPVELSLPKLHVRLTVSFEHLCYVVIDFSWLLISKLYASG